jgi:hypothetical protein
VDNFYSILPELIGDHNVQTSPIICQLFSQTVPSTSTPSVLNNVPIILLKNWDGWDPIGARNNTWFMTIPDHLYFPSITVKRPKFDILFGENIFLSPKSFLVTPP